MLWKYVSEITIKFILCFYFANKWSQLIVVGGCKVCPIFPPNIDLSTHKLVVTRTEAFRCQDVRDPHTAVRPPYVLILAVIAGESLLSRPADSL